MTAFDFAVRVDSGTMYMLVVLLLLIFMPTTLFFGYQMIKKKTNIVVSKRYPLITLTTSIIYSFRLIISSIIIICITTSTIDIRFAAYKLLLAIDNILLYLFLTFLIWRLWNMNCDLQWINAAITDNQWRQMISTQEDNDNINYGNSVSCYLFINNSFGKSSFCGKLLVPILTILFFLLINIPLFILPYNNVASIYISRIIYMITIFVLLILFIITPKKVASNKDAFYIVSELKLIFFCNLLIFLVSISIFIYDRFFYIQSSDLYDYRFIHIMIEQICYYVFEWLICMFSTFWVLAKTGEMFGRYNLSRNRNKTQVKMVQMDKNAPKQLWEALRSNDIFEKFLYHLASEFSLQTMLALIEFLQFQRYCQRYFIKNPIAYQTLLPENESLSLESDQIRLPDNLPKSDIVYLNSETEVKLDLNEFFGRTQAKSYNLYEKYIAPGCELVVPFSSNTRQKYIDKMKDENAWLFENQDVKNLYDMMHFLDKSIKDIYALLQNSYATFHQTADQEMFLS